MIRTSLLGLSAVVLALCAASACSPEERNYGSVTGAGGSGISASSSGSGGDASVGSGGAGGEMPLTYHKSGTVDGNGQAVGLGKFIKPNDVGKWWIKSNQLCQQFKTWYDGAPMCFVLERDSADKVKWTRDNGQTGVARIGD